jgi:PAS domain S-box-containing protein
MARSTDRKHIAALREVVAQLRSAVGDARRPGALELTAQIADRAPDAILLADNHGRYVWANDAAAKLLGYSRQALLKLFVWDVTPADAEVDVDALWRTFLRSPYQSGTYRIRRRSGRRKWVYYFAEPRLLPGVHVSVLEEVPPSARPRGRSVTRHRAT